MAKEKEKTNIDRLEPKLAQYQNILQSLHEGYILVDQEANIHDVNSAYCQMVGYSRKELLSMKLTDVRPGMSPDYQKKFIEDVKRKGSKEFEAEHRKKNGETVYLNASVAAIEKGGTTFLLSFVRNITHRKTMLRQLERREQEFKSLYDNNPTPIFHLDLQGNIKRANNAFLEVSGYSEDELKNKHFSELVSPDEHQEVSSHFQEAVKGEPQQNEVTGITKNGQSLLFLINSLPITVENEIVGIFGIAQNITEKRSAEKKLKESEQRFKSLFEHNPHAVFYFDLEGNFLDANTKTSELTGYSNRELIGRNFAPLITERDFEKAERNFEASANGDIRKYEITGTTKQGQEKPVYITNFPMIVEGEIVGVFGIAEDRTEKHRIEQKQKESQQRFRSLFKHNPLPVYYFDLEGNFKEVNQKLVEFTGYSRNQLLQLGFAHFVDENDLERTKKNFQKAKEGIPGTYEISVWVQGGIKKKVHVTKFPIYVNNEITGVYGILKDVTERRATEKKLKESEERWHRLVEENPKPVRITIDNNIIFINEAGVQLYEAGSADELLGKSIFDFIHPEDIEDVKERFHKITNELPVDKIHENRITTSKGNGRVIEVHSVLIGYKGQQAIQTNIYDITDRKKEEEIIQASLKEKQILLQEIHHRVKNNMAVISGLLELQAMNTENENLQGILKESQMRIYSMAMIHEKLYASKSLAAIEFSEYTRELVEVIINTINYISTDVTVRFSMDSKELNINQAIPCGLILNELIVNCYKHAFKNQNTGSILVGFSLKNGTVEISVEDNGKGLPDDFNIDQQQSLGMKIVQTLVAQLDGDMKIYSDRDGGGTCFTISFEESNGI